MSDIDAALEAGEHFYLRTVSVYFPERGETLVGHDSRTPDAVTLSVNRATTPTATATFTFINPDWDWKILAPSRTKLTQAILVVRQRTKSSPVLEDSGRFCLWVSDISAVETHDGTEVTITAHSADWILTHHRIRQDIRRNVLDLDVDAFWSREFQIPVTGAGLDPFFQEFVNLESGLTGTSPGAPTGEAWVPMSINSTMWDVAATLAGHWNDYFVAGLVSLDNPAVTNWDQSQPAITLQPFHETSVPTKDLRPRTGRILDKTTQTNSDWAERLIHTRRWGGDQSQGMGAVEFSETIVYGEPSTDLRPQLAHETWGSEENATAMEALLTRVTERKWKTFLTTRLDLSIWLSHTILLDDTTTEQVAGIVYDFSTGTMQLELTAESGFIPPPMETLTWARGTRSWENISAAWQDATWETNR